MYLPLVLSLAVGALASPINANPYHGMTIDEIAASLGKAMSDFHMDKDQLASAMQSALTELSSGSSTLEARDEQAGGEAGKPGGLLPLPIGGILPTGLTGILPTGLTGGLPPAVTGILPPVGGIIPPVGGILPPVGGILPCSPLSGLPNILPGVLPGLQSLPLLSSLPGLAALPSGISAVAPTGAKILQAFPACATKLSCTYDQIQGLSPANKLSFLKTVQSVIGSKIPNAGSQLNAIQGAIQGLSPQKLVDPSTYGSHLLSGVLQGYQNGAGNVLGLTKDIGGNPAAPLYAQLLKEIQDGTFKNDRLSHDQLWSLATDAGRTLGLNTAIKAQVKVSVNIKRFDALWQLVSQLQRSQSLLNNILALAGPVVTSKLPAGFNAQSFASKLFDVTNAAPLQCLASSAPDATALDLVVPNNPLSIVTDFSTITAVLPALLACYSKLK